MLNRQREFSGHFLSAKWQKWSLYLSDDSALRESLGYGSSTVSWKTVHDLVLVRGISD